jgi:hypothetical protein
MSTTWTDAAAIAISQRNDMKFAAQQAARFVFVPSIFPISVPLVNQPPHSSEFADRLQQIC